MTETRLTDEADFVVIGTGAGGATAARVLAGAGHEVVLLEEGPQLVFANRPRELVDTMREVFRDAGTTLANGKAPFPILQGRVVGGSTAINSGIIWRLPEEIRTDWVRRFGLGELVDESGLDAAFGQLEEELGIADTPEDVMGGNAKVLRAGAEALGLHGVPTKRNAPGCKGAARCLQGCPNRAKQSMDLSYVPRAMKDGARLHPLCRAERVVVQNGRAHSVVGDVLDPDTRAPVGRFEIHARRGVVVGAGVIHTPAILRRSGLRGLVGDRFQAHPGTAVVGRFPESIGMGFGSTQGYQIVRFEDHLKIESLTLPPEMLAARLPGTGAAWQARLAEMDHFAQWAVMVRMEAHGSVRPKGKSGVDVRFTPTLNDLETARKGVMLAARLMFAAGATEVYPWIGRRPEVLHDASEVDKLAEGDLRHRDFHLLGTHLFGTAVAGADPARSVVGPDLQSHEVGGLYVMDASVFPTNIGVNPQHSIMGVVWRGAERLANETRKPEATGAAKVAAA